LDKIFCSDDRRAPAQCNGIQVNYCKNPLCPNFGVPVSNETQSRGRYANPLKQDGYIAGKRHLRDKKDSLPLIRYTCKYCREEFPAKSNLGIFEEANRYSSYLERPPEPSCPQETCPNHGKSISEYKNLYRYKGLATKARSTKKYLCKACGTHISAKIKSTKRQRIPHRNKYILKALCNKMPLRCIADVFDLEMKTVYDRIDFLYEQCRNFVAARERKLLNGFKFNKLYLSVDRQIYLVNWWDREVKRNVPLYATGCADNHSKYIFAMELNYDPSLNWNEIEDEAKSLNDYARPNAYRRYGRLWLREDFERERVLDELAAKAGLDHTDSSTEGDVEKNIKSRYRQTALRKDVESDDQPNAYLQLPRKGMMVRLDYGLYAFFIHLKKLLAGAEKIRFFLDQESGIRAACLSAFHDEILNRTCDAFYVSINKQMTIDERRRAKREADSNLKEYRKVNPTLTESEARLQILIEHLRKMNEIGQYKDTWFTHPFPTIAEPEKKVSHLTDFNDYSIEHRAWLYNKASLNGINIFFANLRRKQSLLERPISTPSSLNRKWYGYSPYDPGIINKILLIHRVWYNYVKKNRRTKITPAMRLGLAKGPVDPEVIIYGRTVAEPLGRTVHTEPVEKKVAKDFLKRPEPIREQKINFIPPIKSLISSSTDSSGADQNLSYQTVYLDIETTGLDLKDEIIEIAIVDASAAPLINSLVKNEVEIHPKALEKHGITKDMTADAPTLKEIEDDIIKAVKDKHVVAYNSRFEMRYITGRIKNAIAMPSCCMLEFADYYGRLKNEPAPYQWRTLKFASRHVKYQWSGPHHRALSDALACRAVWQHMMKNQNDN